MSLKIKLLMCLFCVSSKKTVIFPRLFPFCFLPPKLCVHPQLPRVVCVACCIDRLCSICTATALHMEQREGIGKFVAIDSRPTEREVDLERALLSWCCVVVSRLCMCLLFCMFVHNLHVCGEE